MSEPTYSDPVEVTEGEWAGWQSWPNEPFESRAGPFYMRRDENGERVSAFRAEPHHMNGAGVMHGGCMFSFADFSLFNIAHDELAGDHSVTLNLSGDFLGPIRLGQLVESRGEVTRGGGKTIFIRGLVTADGTPALSFTGIIRKLAKR